MAEKSAAIKEIKEDDSAAESKIQIENRLPYKNKSET